MVNSFVLVLLVSLFQVLAFAANSECGKETIDNVDVAWCIETPTPSKSQDVLFYLHGAGGNEGSWQNNSYTRAIKKEWSARGKKIPTVISISFGQAWILTEVEREGRPSLYKLVVNKVIPQLEAKIGGVQGRRMLLGESMGGLNSAQLILKGDVSFERAALVCPAISPISPYSSPEEMDAFLKRHQKYIKKEFVTYMLEWALQEFPTEQDWFRHDPIHLIREHTGNLPKLYVSCGDRDEYGFFEGAKKFADLAKEKNIFVQWDPIAGGHCVANPKGIARFFE